MEKGNHLVHPVAAAQFHPLHMPVANVLLGDLVQTIDDSPSRRAKNHVVHIGEVVAEAAGKALALGFDPDLVSHELFRLETRRRRLPFLADRSSRDRAPSAATTQSEPKL